MGNGASSSNNDSHGLKHGDGLEAPLTLTTTNVFNWNMQHSEADEGPLTDISSSCSSISHRIDDSGIGAMTSDITPASSFVDLANFSIVDSTLREGEQFAAAHFDTTQKIQIARALDDFGIELTSPAASEQSRADCEIICKLGLRAKILCHIRCDMSDASIAVQSGVDGINMCIGTSPQLIKHSHGKDMDYIAAKAQEIIEYVKSNNIEIRFSGEDSFRSDFSEILKLYSLVDRLGADRVGIADTVGGATPMEVYDKIDALRKAVSCDIETHFHNDTGCAIANALVALEAGATHFDTTVLGIGERNGITPLGGLMACVMQTDRKFILSKYKLEKLGYLENLVAQIVGVEIPFNNFVLSLKDME
ncbi:homocitrate synthase [Apiosordaria backusii]|uniref:Homocitrate synthase n=1 Tax=Apiosordaria backusii TaxID=314023 RepID=A0AA40ET04_9PEZI|nr:homocitrate synthase [Apiosordaria backusii]